MTHFLGLSCIAFYLLAAILFLGALFRGADLPFKLARACLVLGFILQSILIVPIARSQESLLLSQRGEYFFWLAWSIPLIYFLFRSRLDSPIVGAFLAPCTILFLASSSYLVHLGQTLQSTHANGPLLLLHVVPALLAEVSLVIVFVVSAAFLVQERRIRKKTPSSVTWSGPSLEALDGMARRFVLIGFAAMGLAVISGAIWALTAGRSLLSGDFYQWAAILNWLVLAYILYLRTTLHWSGQRLSRISLYLTGIFMAGFLLATLFTGNTVHMGYGL